MANILIAENLTRIRKEKGLSRRDVAKMADIPYSTLGNYEYGVHEVPYDILLKLSSLYECTLEEILGIEKAEEQKETSPVSEEAVYQFLLDTGIVNPGEDLSDEDLEMLSATLQLLAVYFRNRKA